MNEQNSPVSNPASRRLSLDVLRGIAVFLMIEQHLGVWLWNGSGPPLQARPGLLVFNALGGGAAPMFIVLAGIGSSLLCSKNQLHRKKTDRTLWSRGLIVMAFGYLLSFATPSWFSLQSWFVLHLMGFGMLLTPWLRRLPTALILLLAALILACTGPLQALLSTPLALNNLYMSARAAELPAWAGLRIAVVEGQFPIFPWLSLYLMGLACGRWISQARYSLITRSAWVLLAAGLCGVLLWQLELFSAPSGIWRNLHIRVPFFPASPTLVCLILAPVLLAIRALLALEARKPFRSDHPLVCLGRASLSLLLFHVVVFRELSRPLHGWRAFDVLPAMAILWGFVGFALLASWLWQKASYRFGAEWLLRKLSY